MMRHAIKNSKTNDRIFDLHEVSQIRWNQNEQNRTDHNITDEHNRTEPMNIPDSD
jgi:hypothetical protein